MVRYTNRQTGRPSVTFEVVAQAGVAWRRTPVYNGTFLTLFITSLLTRPFADRINSAVGPAYLARVSGTLVQGDVPYVQVLECTGFEAISPAQQNSTWCPCPSLCIADYFISGVTICQLSRCRETNCCG